MFRALEGRKTQARFLDVITDQPLSPLRGSGPLATRRPHSSRRGLISVGPPGLYGAYPNSRRRQTDHEVNSYRVLASALGNAHGT